MMQTDCLLQDSILKETKGGALQRESENENECEKKESNNVRFRSHSHSLFCSQDRRSVELFIIITLIIGGKLDLSGKNMEFRIRVRVNVEVSVKKNDRVCGRIRSHIHSVICSGGES